MELYINLIYNISFLVIVTILLTKINMVKRMIREETSGPLITQVMLGLVFGGLCILSTITGSEVGGAIENTRVVGALAGGLLCGPTTGIVAALLGGIHRYIYDPNGLTAAACMVSTFFEGFVGSFFWYVFHKRDIKPNAWHLFFITLFAEAMQMVIILLIAKPFDDALALVKLIALPMMSVNSLGMILFFSVFRDVFHQQDMMAADKTRQALNIADESVPFIRKARKTESDYNSIAGIISKYSNCKGVLIWSIDEDKPLNSSSFYLPEELKRHLLLPNGIVAVDTVKMPMVDGNKVGVYSVAASQVVLDSDIKSAIVLFFRRRGTEINAEKVLVEGLTKFFTTNYQLAQVEELKKMKNNAELQALQSQINPHFLFNALSTIACFCREKPERARELLMALSVYFRNTLSAGEQFMIPLEEEMEQIRAYLALEEARFEDKLCITFDLCQSEGYDVPPLIIQPIVENAVKHGAMKRSKGIIHISSKIVDREVLLTVEDNGLGIDKDIVENYRNEGPNSGRYGMANVDARLRGLFGEDHGLEIKTGTDGTTVLIRIPHRKEKSE